MKVLQFCRQFSPVSQTFIYDVVLQLDEIKVNNVIVTNVVVNEKERPYSKDKILVLPKIKQNPLKKILLQSLSKIRLYDYDWYDENITIKTEHLVKIIKKEQPLVIHAHFSNTGYEILSAAQRCKVPLVVSFHGFDAFQLSRDELWMNRLSKVFSGASAITVVSQLMKDFLINLGCEESKLKIIHVGKKIEHYEFQKREHSKINNFISIGRLTEKKGHEDCITAFSKAVKKHPNLTLTIIGDGELKGVLLKQVKDLRLENNVKLVGEVTHDITKKYLSDADAFILCSKVAKNGDQEGIPTVLMEAQALGLPCITTFHSGIPEVIPVDNHWMMAKEGDADEIALRIEALINSDSHTIRNAVLLGRNKVISDFNLETEVEKLRKLYISLS